MGTLEHLQRQGFTLLSLPAYPRHVAVEKYHCVALLEPTPEGCWTQFSSAGYLLDGHIALLVERRGRPVFIHKSQEVLAEGAVKESFDRFQRELRSALEWQ